MSTDKDAAFLCGFIAGTYDLKGDGKLPDLIQPYVDRIMGAPPHTGPTAGAKDRALPIDLKFFSPAISSEGSDANIPAVDPRLTINTPENLNTSDDHVQTVDTPPEKKPRKPWSEEARAAQKKRMEAKLATGWRPGQKNSDPSPLPPPEEIDHNAEGIESEGNF